MSTKQLKILVVEDEPAHAELINRSFQKSATRYSITVASSLSEAREKLEEFLPDLMIADWALPDGHGDELVLHQGTLKYPTIIVTSKGNEEVAVEAMKSGALDYIVKSSSQFYELPIRVERTFREWTNILERKKADEKFRYLFENMSNGVVVIEHENQGFFVKELNRSARKIENISEDYGEGNSLTEVLPYFGDEKISSAVREVFSSGNPADIKRHSFTSGEEVFWRDLYLYKLPTDEVVIVITDITESMRAEEAQRISEQRLRDIAENINDVFWLRTREKILYISPAFSKVFGRPPEIAYENPDFFVEIAHPEDKDRIYDAFHSNEYLEEGLLDQEYRLIQPFGSTVWVHIKTFPVQKKNGSFRTVGIAQDVTKRKIAEGSLQQWAQIFMNAEWGVVTTSPNGRTLEKMNPAFARMHGYSMQELAGKPTALIIAPEMLEKTPEHFEIAARRGHNIFESFHIRKDGTVFPVITDITTIKDHDGNTLFRVINVVDITDRKKAEEALRASETKFRSLSESSQDLILRYDRMCRITYMNAAALNTLNLKENDIVKKRYSTIFGEDDISIDWEKQIKEVFKTGKPFQRQTNIVIDDEERTLHKVLTPEFNDEGAVKFVMEVARDISELKKVEKELIKARDKAELADRLKSEFLAQMSHEIRTPINVILNYSALIAVELVSIVSEDLRECFTGIEVAGKRLIRTIDLILNMSEIQIGSYDYRPIEVNLYGDVIVGLLDEFRILADEKNLELELYNTAGKQYIKADEYNIRQILTNLIDNAIKYTDEGKVEIFLEDCGDDFLCLRVKDTGIGMSEEYLERLFDPFSQEDQGYSRRFEGTGLGLALVKKYCELNEAEIEVDSVKGRGTTFTIKFQALKEISFED